MRRNRIKAVINVPRGGRPSAGSSGDRAQTPVPAATHEPSVSAVALIPRPGTPGSGSGRHSPLRSPPPPPRRSQSPLVSAIMARADSPSRPRLSKSPVKSVTFSTLVSAKSPEPIDRSPNIPPRLVLVSPRPHSPLVTERERGGAGDYAVEQPSRPGSAANVGVGVAENFPLVAVASQSQHIPISPGGIQRPSPAASPGGFRYVSSGILGSPQRSRPSPSPSPGMERSRHVMLFNANSNSADSHEVARYMCPPQVPQSPRSVDLLESHNRQNFNQGAFSSLSAMRDPANAIVNNSELLRQRLSKPSPALTISKYQTLRKEFMTKAATSTPERHQLTMLHFAFWNPPKAKDRSSSRNRASSVCSDRGASRNEVDESLNDTDSKMGIAARRATVGDAPLTASSSRRTTVDSDTHASDAESTTSGSQKSGSIGPRVKVGPDGQLIIDEQSLVVETSESQRAKKQLSEMETVSGNDFAVGSSGMFRNKRSVRRGHDWTEKETIKFYKALSMCGTDFSMMTTLFKLRTRAELKAKFKREDRKNPGQISLALSCQEFDPDLGFTDDSDEEPAALAEEVVVVAKGKSTKRKSIKPLSEIERRLQEELEISRTLFSAEDSNSVIEVSMSSSPSKTSQDKGREDAENQRQPQPQKNSKRKKGAGGKSVPAWKTTKIVEDEDVELPPPWADAVNEAPTPKKARRRRVVKPKIRVTQKEQNKDARTPTPTTETSQEASAIECIEILRFDASDPMGLKVTPLVPRRALISESEVPLSDDITTLTPVVDPPTNPFRRMTRSRSRSTSVDSFTSTSLSQAFSHPPINVKPPLPGNVRPLPYRVPGPGPTEASPNPSMLLEEIEIEISCQ